MILDNETTDPDKQTNRQTDEQSNRRTDKQTNRRKFFLLHFRRPLIEVQVLQPMLRRPDWEKEFIKLKKKIMKSKSVTSFV